LKILKFIQHLKDKAIINPNDSHNYVGQMIEMLKANPNDEPFIRSEMNRWYEFNKNLPVMSINILFERAGS